MRIEGISGRRLPTQRITILRGEASHLPDIPREEVKKSPTREELDARNDFLARHRPPVFLQLGATIYDHRISVVTWRHPEDPKLGYEAVVGLDFGIFANAGDFIHEGVAHSLILMHSNVPTDGLRRLGGGWWRGPELPEVEEGRFVVTAGDSKDAAGMSPLVKLLELYAVEKERLLEAHGRRLRYLRDAAEWRRLNPDPPEPAEVTYWLRPHRGSRYLAEPKAEGGAR